MKKIMLILSIFLCFLMSTTTQIAYAENESSKYVVVANSAVIYQSPDFSSEKLATLKHNQIIEILSENNSPKTFFSDNYSFFKIINHNDIEGYILSDLVVPENDVITATPNFNAKLNTTCKVYFNENSVISESEITLNKNHQIFLYEGFNEKEKFTAVAFVYDNQVLYGYIETKWIDPNGINPLIITCIIVILAILGIVFAWVFIKNKKVKLKKSARKL